MMRDNTEMASISENPGNVKRVQRNYLNKYFADGKKILEYMMFNGQTHNTEVNLILLRLTKLL